MGVLRGEDTEYITVGTDPSGGKDVGKTSGIADA